MKFLLAFLTLVAAGIVALTVTVSPSVVAEWERSFPVSNRTDRPDRSEEADREAVAARDAQEERAESVLQNGGIYFRDFREPFPEEFERKTEEKLAGRMLSGGDFDYKSFAFRDRMTPLSEPLSDDELAFVFSKIVSSRTSSVPIRGLLEELSFRNEGGVLSVRAVVTISFSDLSKAYGISFLPPSATFVLSVPFSVKNADISAYSDKIELSCDAFTLPKALLVFACNAAFGKKDYQTLFGEALENVFVNGGIYGESIARAREK